MSDRKYSNNKLQELAEADLIWPKKHGYYRKLLETSIKEKDWDLSKLTDGDQEDNLHHDELWYDVCAIVNDLAQLVLDERAKRASFLKELKRELRDTIKDLSSKEFEKYY